MCAGTEKGVCERNLWAPGKSQLSARRAPRAHSWDVRAAAATAAAAAALRRPPSTLGASVRPRGRRRRHYFPPFRPVKRVLRSGRSVGRSVATAVAAKTTDLIKRIVSRTQSACAVRFVAAAECKYIILDTPVRSLLHGSFFSFFHPSPPPRSTDFPFVNGIVFYYIYIVFSLLISRARRANVFIFSSPSFFPPSLFVAGRPGT